MTTKTIVKKQASSAPKRNHIAFVLDGSGSIGWAVERIRTMINALLKVHREESARTGIETTITVIGFSWKPHTVILGERVENVEAIGTEFYDGGNTALRDGVAHAIDELAALPGYNDPNTSFLVNVYTDGQENNSNRSVETVKRMMLGRQATDRWTFTFQVPPGGKACTARAFGITEGAFHENIREWEQSTAGVERATIASVVGTQSYYSSRSVGLRSVDNFYAETDASKLTTAKIAQKLDDVSGRFRVYPVAAEDRINAFVSGKTGRDYVVGQGYYLLMKPEVVQGHKKVLIREKGKAAVWGGDEARALIGLSPTSTQKVTPGNHSKYDIFVQSTSVNRILPRGTCVAVDTQMTQGLKPTWDHVKAQEDADKKRAEQIGNAIAARLAMSGKETPAKLENYVVSTLGEPYRLQVAKVIENLKAKGKLQVVGRSLTLVKAASR